MKNKVIKVIIISAVSICSGVIAYFMPVDISLNPQNKLVQGKAESQMVLVSEINIFGKIISDARVDDASIEPQDFASAEKSVQKGKINIVFNKSGNGKLSVRSKNYTGLMVLVSAMPDEIIQTAKPESKLRVLFNKYKHVEKVFLRDGTILFGVMYERGSGIDFITPDGKLKLSKDDIVRVVYLKPESL